MQGHVSCDYQGDSSHYVLESDFQDSGVTVVKAGCAVAPSIKAVYDHYRRAPQVMTSGIVTYLLATLLATGQAHLNRTTAGVEL